MGGLSKRQALKLKVLSVLTQSSLTQGATLDELLKTYKILGDVFRMLDDNNFAKNGPLQTLQPIHHRSTLKFLLDN
jgi:hypothetical protein